MNKNSTADIPVNLQEENPAYNSGSISRDRRERDSTDSTLGELAGGEVKRKGSWLSRFQLVYDLENKGSVARDHLANERTYLAWLRTSLALASIGIAVTQLFRLTRATPSSSSSSPQLSVINQFNYQQLLSTLSDPPTKLEIQNLLLQLTTTEVNVGKYRYLAQPIGATFIAMALLFLLLGTIRFFKVQSSLMQEPSMFIPSRKSVSISTFTVGTLVIVSFSVILATK